MKYILFFIALITIQNLKAQLRTGVKGFYGRSIVLNEMIPVRPPLDTYPTAYDHNFGVGAYLQYDFNNWFGIETGLIFEQIRTYEGYFVKADTTHLLANELEFDENGLADYYATEQWIRTNYLSIPLGLTFRRKKFRFGFGGQFSYLLKAGSAYKIKQHNLLEQNQTFTWANEFYFHRRYNITAYAMVGFEVFDNWSLEVKFIEGLSDISTAIFNQSKFWTRQFQVGLAYEIVPRKNK